MRTSVVVGEVTIERAVGMMRPVKAILRCLLSDTATDFFWNLCRASFVRIAMLVISKILRSMPPKRVLLSTVIW